MDSDEITVKHVSQTLGRITLNDFLPDDNRLRGINVLKPVLACVTESMVIDKDDFIIGRGSKADFVLKDKAVSARHSRIRQVGNDCVLEDLGSSNGTYVDGVPIVSCVLKGGDMVQFGRNLFLFDCLLEYAETKGRAV
mgnify:CR=1 FL=1